MDVQNQGVNDWKMIDGKLNAEFVCCEETDGRSQAENSQKNLSSGPLFPSWGCLYHFLSCFKTLFSFRFSCQPAQAGVQDSFPSIAAAGRWNCETAGVIDDEDEDEEGR